MKRLHVVLLVAYLGVVALPTITKQDEIIITPIVCDSECIPVELSE